jgi:hypothetical protein
MYPTAAEPSRPLDAGWEVAGTSQAKCRYAVTSGPVTPSRVRSTSSPNSGRPGCTRNQAGRANRSSRRNLCRLSAHARPPEHGQRLQPTRPSTDAGRSRIQVAGCLPSAGGARYRPPGRMLDIEGEELVGVVLTLDHTARSHSNSMDLACPVFDKGVQASREPVDGRN